MFAEKKLQPKYSYIIKIVNKNMRRTEPIDFSE